MRILLVRHAEAVDQYSTGATTDAARYLTDRGHAQADALAAALDARGVRLGKVAVSPLVRAGQTGEPLRRLAGGGDLVTCEYLTPEQFRPKKLVKFVGDLSAEAVAVVGHMPTIAAYAAWLLGVDENAVPFEKAAAMMVDLPADVRRGTGTLVWFVSPTWFDSPVSDASPA